jgi:D-aminoacyl-tRNA deacylase
VLCGITHDDTDIDIDYIIPKLLNLKLFEDSSGKGWKQNVVDANY